MFGLLYFGAGLLYLLLSIGLAFLVSRLARRWGREGWRWGLAVFAGMLLLVFWDWLPMVVSFDRLCGSRAGFVQYEGLEQWKREHPGVADSLVPYDLRRPDPASLPPHEYQVWEEEEVNRWGQVRRIEHYRYPSRMEVRVTYELRPAAAGGSGEIARVEVLVPGRETVEGSYLNRRFGWLRERKRHWFHIIERDEWIVDLETGEVLVRYVDFGTDIPPLAVNRNVPGAYKIWLMRRSCPRGHYPDAKWIKNGDSFKGWLVRFKKISEEQG